MVKCSSFDESSAERNMSHPILRREWLRRVQIGRKDLINAVQIKAGIKVIEYPRVPDKVVQEAAIKLWRIHRHSLDGLLVSCDGNRLVPASRRTRDSFNTPDLRRAHAVARCPHRIIRSSRGLSSFAPVSSNSLHLLHGICSKFCHSLGRRECLSQFFKNIAAAMEQGISSFTAVGHATVA